MSRLRLLPAVSALVLAASSLEARIVPYAPVTSAAARPAVQPRASQHFLLAEEAPRDPSCGSCSSRYRLVVHEAEGGAPPKVVLPRPGGGPVMLTTFALFEPPQGPPYLFAGTDADLAGENPQRFFRYLLSTDGGDSWTDVPIGPLGVLPPAAGAEQRDHGGPVAGGRGARVLPGSVETPFVVVGTPFFPTSGSTLFAIDRTAHARPLFLGAPATTWPIDLSLLGSDAGGTRFLVVGTPLGGTSTTGRAVWSVDLAGAREKVLDLPLDGQTSVVNGWIRPDRRAYLETVTYSYQTSRTLLLAGGGTSAVVYQISPASETQAPDYVTRPLFVAVPSKDFSGGWIAARDQGTRLLRVTGGSAAAVWNDPARPLVEALHVGASGTRLLVQVDRLRPPRNGGWGMDIDPAFAVWEEGRPAPAGYDELLAFSGSRKRFVHLDVDALALGASFVFDSAHEIQVVSGGPSGGGGSGGSDLLQEWGVVRGSLQQRLVVPSVSRAEGVLGAGGRSDLVLRNPDADPLRVLVHFAGPAIGEKTYTLGARQIRLVSDVLADLGIPHGSGALVLVPDPLRSIDATSRTWAPVASGGTQGTGVPAVDATAATSPGFPITFAAALGGSDTHARFVAADPSPAGADLTLTSATAAGAPRQRTLHVPGGGQEEVEDLAAFLGVPAADAGALGVTSTAGSALCGVLLSDDSTGDPTWFGPDIPTAVSRTIPAVVHTVGMAKVSWRSDLYAFNPSTSPQTLLLSVKDWDRPQTDETMAVVLDPGESQVFPDVLWSYFRRWGVARLKAQTIGSSGLDANAVRVTTRVVADDGVRTRGFAMPPLNSFQSAQPTETLTILGALGGAGFRTNLALVELSPGEGVPAVQTVPVSVEVYDPAGALVTSFGAEVPLAGGVQITDLFHARGLGDGPPVAFLRISVSGTYGRVGAYATSIDVASGDAVYLAANLEP